MCNNMINLFVEDYIIMVKGKGLSENCVVFNYVVCNVLLLSVIVFFMLFGMVIGG